MHSSFEKEQKLFESWRKYAKEKTSDLLQEKLDLSKLRKSLGSLKSDKSREDVFVDPPPVAMPPPVEGPKLEPTDIVGLDPDEKPHLKTGRVVATAKGAGDVQIDTRKLQPTKAVAAGPAQAPTPQEDERQTIFLPDGTAVREGDKGWEAAVKLMGREGSIAIPTVAREPRLEKNESLNLTKSTLQQIIKEELQQLLYNKRASE